MLNWQKTLFLSVGVLAVMSAGAASAAEVGILPPDIDYEKVCVKKEAIQKDDFDWTGKTPATSGLSPERLILIANLYYSGSGKTPPDYKRASDIVEYLIDRDMEFKNEALFLKYDMLLKGRYFSQNANMAKAILDKLVAANDAEAHSRYGDLYVEEGDYSKAAEHYKKAFIGGEPTAAMALAYLYHDKKVPATDAEITAMIVQAQDAAMQYLMRGNCHSLTLFGLMYARMDNIPKAEYYSAKWFEKAALLDEVAPKLDLAAIIQRGYVIQYDEKRVLELWREAADLGSDRAMFLLGEHSFLNHKNDDDLKTAVSWFEKSAERRNVKAMEMLARLYDGSYPAIQDAEKRRRWLEKAVTMLDVKDKTIMHLAELYEKISDVPPEKVFELYQMAASKGNNQAYAKLGESYRYGVGVEASPARALRYYRLAAGNAETSSMEALKQTYECGIGAEKNEAKVVFWKKQITYYNGADILGPAYAFLKSPIADEAKQQKIREDLSLFAISRKNPEAMAVLGLFLKKIGKDRDGEKWVERALAEDRKDKKDFAAHALLGEILLNGEYGEQDLEEGTSLLDIAAKAGNAEANNVLGKWYKNHGDFAKAAGYLKAAGEGGKSSAFLKLAEILIGQKNASDALIYLEKAARQHDIGAMLKLAEGYKEGGWTGMADADKSSYWFSRALKSFPCKVGDIVAVSEVYLKGKYGVPKDEVEAAKWIEKLEGISPEDDKDSLKIAQVILSSGAASDPAKREKAISLLEGMAERGNAEAASFLAGIYLDRGFSGYDSKKAMFWITKSADAGDVASMMELANMYMSGYGVPPSVQTAKSWLEKAAKAGNAEAVQRLKKIESGSAAAP
jgi:TPR repeat protein